MDKYVKVKPLGKGSFGSAILIKRRSDNQLLVVKEINLSKMSSKEREEARNECRVLQQLNHPNIVRYMEHYEHNGVLYIIMEYADGGDLAQKIKENGGRGIKEDTSMFYFSQLCLALEYLHSRHILHRDIKTMNIFLMKNGTVKLGDFGISTVLRNTMGMANTVCGTPYYFSPELCKNKPYNNRSDVWALGVVLYELLTGKHPFDANSMQQLMQRIVKSSYAPVSTVYSKEIRQLVDVCLQKDPMRRPNIKQVVGHVCVRRAFEKLETDLMLATQCRVRLQDIIDFPAKGSGRSNASSNASPQSGALDKPQHPSQPPRQPTTSPPPPLAGGVAKQQLLQQQPPGAPYAAANGMMPLLPQRSNEPQQPQAAHFIKPNPFVIPSQAPAPLYNNNPLKADLDRVDAFIRQLNQPVNDRAKDAIQEYMKRKAEEQAERKRREAEALKKQEERNAELRRVLEEHHKQVLEQAKLRQQRQQVQQQQAPQQQPSQQQVRQPPQAIYQAYGVPTPRKQPKHVLAANSPANARKSAAAVSPSNRALQAPSPSGLAAPQHLVPRSVSPPPVTGPNARAVVAERAQHWADRQAERRRLELDRAKKTEDDRRIVRDLPDVPGGAKFRIPSLSIDPELEAWARRDDNSARDAIAAHGQPTRETSPQPQGYVQHDDLPAGVAHRQRSRSHPKSEDGGGGAQRDVLRHASAVDEVFREHHHGRSAPPMPDPRTPPLTDRTSNVEFRRGLVHQLAPPQQPLWQQQANQPLVHPSSRPVSPQSQAAFAPVALRPSDVPEGAIDGAVDCHSRTAPHVAGRAVVETLSGAAPPMLRYPTADDRTLNQDMPDILRSLRQPAVLDSIPPVAANGNQFQPPSSGSGSNSGAVSPELHGEVPVAAYEMMLDQIKHALEKRPVGNVASRHHAALLDADMLSDDAVVEVLDTEAYMLDDDDGDDDDDDDDFADDEPLTPSAQDAAASQSNDGSAGVDEELDLTSDFPLRDFCGRGFRGQLAVHPSTGAPLFPLGSVSRHTNEFQLQVLLEKRLGAMGLEAVSQQVEVLANSVGFPIAARQEDELRLLVATHLAKVRRTPTASLSPSEVDETFALACQLHFFRDD